MQKLFLLFWSVVCTATVGAQSYAPETDYHDRVQRAFAVEAARVLAWQENAAGGAIAEVTYDLESPPEGEIVWHIQWRDAQKMPVREKTVRYPSSLLLEGPKYFREVFAQLADDSAPPKSNEAGAINAAFWNGAKLAGVSRVEAIEMANNQVAAAPHIEKAADAARLAGTLVHGSVSLLASPLTVDTILLGRGAAWLCLAEHLAGTRDDAAWAPILFLAGRERYARTAWDKAPAPAEVDRGEAGKFWDLILHTPSTRDCFLFAAQLSNRQFALPAMTYPAQYDRAWMDLLAELSDQIVGGKMMTRLFEYGPNVSARGRRNGGQWGARMPGIAMKAWLESLAAFRPPPNDYTEYEPIMKEAARKVRATGEDEGATIAAMAPLLNLGFDNGTGPLIPVATVTARDMLEYGWEMAGLQLGYTYNYLSKGESQLAKEIGRPALEQIKGIDPFFKAPTINPRYPLEDLRRLQFVGSWTVEVATLNRMPREWQEQATRYLSRRWLARGGNVGIEAAIRYEAKPEELRHVIDRLRREGGPLAVCNLVNHDPDMKYVALIDQLGMRDAMLNEMPWQYAPRPTAVEDEYKKKAGFQYAMKLEKVGWSSLTFPNHYRIFSNYVIGNAEAAAKRFYDEVQPFVTDRVAFSNATGPARYVLAWIEGDEEGEETALEDSACFSYSDIHLQLVDALLHGKYDRARNALDATIRRYGNDRDRTMKKYLPQIAALLDSNDAGHARAIAEFPDDKQWLFLRWALARQAHLPVEDVVHLFRDKTDGEDGIFAAAARGDKEHFRSLYVQLILDPMERILITHEFLKLFNSKPPGDQPDLKPPGARPIKEEVLEELRRQREKAPPKFLAGASGGAMLADFTHETSLARPSEFSFVAGAAARR